MTKFSKLKKLSFIGQITELDLWGSPFVLKNLSYYKYETTKKYRMKFGMRVWPNLNAKVANSLEIVGLTFSSYTVLPSSGKFKLWDFIKFEPKTTGRNSL